MRAFLLLYWAIGCFLIGGAMAERLKACPSAWHEQAFGAELFTGVIVWPAAVIAVLAARSSAPADVTCKSAPLSSQRQNGGIR